MYLLIFVSGKKKLGICFVKWKRATEREEGKERNAMTNMQQFNPLISK